MTNGDWTDYAEDVQAALVEISQWIDNAPANAARDREAATWGRLAKIQEEAGEVIAEFIAYTGQNPRKPRNEDALIGVAKELLDVALTALAAYEHMTSHQGLAFIDLFDHIYTVQARGPRAGQVDQAVNQFVTHRPYQQWALGIAPSITSAGEANE